jgi:hypothetical protein
MRNNRLHTRMSHSDAEAMMGPFQRDAIVLVTLNSPREKFWGAVLAISGAGLSIRGIDLNSFEDFIRQVKAGEQVMAHTVFFPLHRVERIELDTRDGDIPSLQERFINKAGIRFSEMVAGLSSGEHGE